MSMINAVICGVSASSFTSCSEDLLRSRETAGPGVAGIGASRAAAARWVT